MHAFDLEPNGHAASVFRLDTEVKFGGDGALVEVRPAKQRFQNFSQPIQDWSDRACGCSDKIYVFRVGKRRWEMKLIRLSAVPPRKRN
ncbi:hypothetical protein RGCCGE502_34146 (plasmid) [Rhizobium grahamii CCGE 502]|uniref:Uncharacterized protein n=1 Tax=Rhizobium grahamii CCGE 502 TaxID=990285 RepID=S3H5B4_9HYPH|nr:hypothetical protein RGCCGE502_34146 [Rhizobium grahamii CCGE 502]